MLSYRVVRVLFLPVDMNTVLLPNIKVGLIETLDAQERQPADGIVGILLTHPMRKL